MSGFNSTVVEEACHPEFFTFPVRTSICSKGLLSAATPHGAGVRCTRALLKQSGSPTQGTKSLTAVADKP